MTDTDKNADILLGIDAGGTHTDAVAVRQGRIVARTKQPTGVLAQSVHNALAELCATVPVEDIARINLSSTLATNAVAEKRLEPVGIFVCAGPGIDPQEFSISDEKTGRETSVKTRYFVIPGATDFRGKILQQPDQTALDNAIAQAAEAGLRSFAVIAKFSPRNPALENHIATALRKGIPDTLHISLGHKLSGRLNFPRRIVTTYYNAAVRAHHNAFADAVESAMREFSITAPVHILKADGGTMPLARSRAMPVESILSGPSASVMGTLALTEPAEDCIMLDIGGSTTDIALFADGSPLLAPEGINVANRPSLLRALLSTSIAIGGDTAILTKNGTAQPGNARKDFSLAFGGAQATLTDALNTLALENGDTTSIAGDGKASHAGICLLAQQIGRHAADVARYVVDAAIAQIVGAVHELTEHVNTRPVYTLREFLHDRQLMPRRMYLVGGPAKILAPYLERASGMPVAVLAHYDIANAVGAALAATTAELELYADTAKGNLTIPALGVQHAVSPAYSLDDARAEAAERLHQACIRQGIAVNAQHIAITEASSFAMIEGMRRSGATLRVRAQLRPALLEHLNLKAAD